MFIKSAAVAALAFAAAVAAQTPNHTYFTNPVTDDMVYTMGSKQTFSWALPCTAPQAWISSTPTNASVQLLNANNADNAFFLQDVTTIDCTAPQGNTAWTIPTNVPAGGMYSLKIIVDASDATKSAYSGRFKIVAAGAAVSPTATGTTAQPTATGKSAASSIAPVLSGAAAIVAAAALLL